MQDNIQDFLIKILNELLQMPVVQSRESWRETGELFLNRVKDKMFRLVVVGEFSSGKSTFINALIGRDLLSHASKETTAVLTRLINVSADDPRKETVEIYMKDGTKKQIQQVTRQKLEEYTTKSSKTFTVEKEIDYVNIYVPVVRSSTDFMIVDTPGLNGMSPGLREQTEQMVMEAHACIYLIPRHGFSKTDIEFIHWLTNYQKNFIFLQNFLDEFKAEEGDTFTQRKADIENALKNNILLQHPGLNYKICGVSSLLELHKRDTEVKIKGMEYSSLGLSDDTGFSELKAQLQEMLEGSKALKIKYQDTAEAILHWCMEIRDAVRQKKEQVEEAYDASKEKDSAQKLGLLKEKVQKRKPKEMAALDGFIISYCHKLQTLVDKSFEESCRDLERKIVAEIDAINSFEAFEHQRKDLPNELSNGFYQITKGKERYIGFKLNELYQLIRNRIEEYSGIKSTGLELKSFHMQFSPVQQFKLTESFNIEDTKRRIDRLSKNISEARESSRDLNRQISVRNNEKDEKDRAIWRSQRQERNALSNMGSRPPIEEHAEERTGHRKRTGLFSGIRNFFLGDEEYTYTEIVRDDSNQRAWDNQRAQIQNQYRMERQNLQRRKIQIESQIRSLRLQKDNADSEIDNLLKRKREAEDDLRANIKLREDALKKAKAKYLRTEKAAEKGEIHHYIYGSSNNKGICQLVQNQLQIVISDEMAKAQKIAAEKFEISYQKKLSLLDEARTKNTSQMQRQITAHASEVAFLQNKIEEMRGVLV